jgi:hypothetical protein
MTDDPLDGMRERIEKCRRLAKDILDPKASEALRQMALDIERDLRTLEAERAGRPTSSMPNPMRQG